MTGPTACAVQPGEGIVPRYEDGSSGEQNHSSDCETDWSVGAPVRFPILAVTRQELVMNEESRPSFEDQGRVHNQDLSGDEDRDPDRGNVLLVEPPNGVELRHTRTTENSSYHQPRRGPPAKQNKLSQASSVDITKETSATQEPERILSFPKQDITKDKSYEEDPDRLNLKSILRMLEKPSMDAYKHRWQLHQYSDVFHARQPFSSVEIEFNTAMRGRRQPRATTGPPGYFFAQRPRTMPMDSVQRSACRPLDGLRPVSVSKSFDDRGRQPTAPPPSRAESSSKTSQRRFDFGNLEFQSPLRVCPLHGRSKSFQAPPRKLKPVVKPSTARSWDGSYDRTVSPTYCTDILRTSALTSPRDSAKALAIHSLSCKDRKPGNKEQFNAVERTKCDAKQADILRVPQPVMESQEKQVKFTMRKGHLTREDTFLSDMEPRYMDYTLGRQKKMSREMTKLLKKSHNPTRPPANTPVPVTPEY